MPGSFSEIPFFRIVLAFIAGLLLYGLEVRISIFILPALALFFLVLAYTSGKTVWNYSLMGMALFLLILLSGFYRVQTTDQIGTLNHFSTQQCEGDELLLRARIDEVNDRTNFTRLLISVKEAACSQKPESASMAGGRLLLQIRNTDSSTLLIPGQTIEFTGKIGAIPQARNPHAFSFKDFMARQRVYHRGFLDGEELNILDKNPSQLTSRIHRFRKSFLSNLKTHTNMEETPGLITGIVLGDKSLMDDQIYSAFRDVGAAHVLAVSGLHVGIVYSLFYLFLKRAPSIPKALITLTGVWAFILFAGAPPSAIRAGSMFSLFCLGQLFQKKAHSINILSFCAFLHLFYDPNLLADIGFQFSYMALLGILVFFRKINAFLPIPNKWIQPLRDLVSLSIAAQIGVLPLSIYYFNQASPYFMFSSIFSITGAYLILTGGLLVGLLGFILPKPATVMGWLMDYLCWILAEIMKLFNTLPAASFKELHLTIPELLVIYGLIVLFALIIYQRMVQWKKPVILAMGLLVFTGFSHSYHKMQTHAVYIYSVGNEVLIDLFSPHRINTVKSPTLKDRTEKFAAAGNRMVYKSGNRQSDTLYLNEERSLKLIRGKQSDLVIVKGKVPTNLIEITNRPFHLILTYNSSLSADQKESIRSASPLSIISGGANTRRTAVNLEEVAQQLDVPYGNSFHRYVKIKDL